MAGLRLTAVDAGPLRPDKNKLVAFAAGTVAIPTTVGIIEHPKGGLVLWDTGINDAVADPDRGEAYWGPGIRDAFGAHGFTREHAIDAQLERLGMRPADVRYVVYSHLHLDHAGGMSYFPNAIHIGQRDEFRYAMWPDPWNRPVYCPNDFRDIRGLDIMEIDGDFDLFADGTMRLVKTPGHTPGHQSLVVDGTYVLVGDACYCRLALDSDTLPPSAFDHARQREGFAWLRAQEAMGRRLMFSHDLAQWESLPPVLS